MSYRAKKEGSYGYYRRRNTRKPFVMKKTHKKELFGLPVTKDTEVFECTQTPSEIDEEEKTSLGVNVGNQIGNIGVSGAKEDKKEHEILTIRQSLRLRWLTELGLSFLQFSYSKPLHRRSAQMSTEVSRIPENSQKKLRLGVDTTFN